MGRTIFITCLTLPGLLAHCVEAIGITPMLFVGSLLLIESPPCVPRCQPRSGEASSKHFWIRVFLHREPLWFCSSPHHWPYRAFRRRYLHTCAISSLHHRDSKRRSFQNDAFVDVPSRGTSHSLGSMLSCFRFAYPADSSRRFGSTEAWVRGGQEAWKQWSMRQTIGQVVDKQGLLLDVVKKNWCVDVKDIFANKSGLLGKTN